MIEFYAKAAENSGKSLASVTSPYFQCQFELGHKRIKIRL
jgi:hypothetical protein